MLHIRKSLVLALAALTALSVAATGCSSGASTASSAASASSQTASASSADSSASAASSESASSADSLSPHNIVWYLFDDAQVDTSAVVQEINNYLSASTDLKNTTVSMYELGFGDYNTKMPVIVASGQAFDLCFTASWALNYSTYAAQGAFVDLTKTGLLEKYGSGIKTALGDTLIKGASINGDLYAVPVNKEAAYQWALTFNDDLLKKYSIDLSAVNSASTPMAKLQAVTPILKKVHDGGESNLILTSFIGNSSILGITPYFNNPNSVAGIDAYKTDGKVENVYATSYFSDYCNLMREWYQAGYIQSDAATLTTNDAAKNIFMDIKSYTPYAELGGKYSMTAVPLQDPIIAGAVGTGSMTAISSTSTDPERDMMFLNLLYSDKKLLNLVDFGIEGKDYKLDESGKVTQLTMNAASSSSTATNLYAPQRWTQGNQLLSLLMASEKDDKWDKYKAFNDSAKLGQDIGFNFDASSVTSEVSALSNVISQYSPSLITGSVDPKEYLPKFLSALDAAGAAKVVTEVQSQYDKWKTTSK